MSIELRRAYAIDVCLTCGAQAVYPYACGHRPENYDPQVKPWCAPITVVPTQAAKRFFKEATS